MNEISILLSTFNGEKFIKELLNSVLNQTINNFKIFVRDDGSTDQTPNLINAFKIKYPDVFIILNDEKGNLGPRDSFFELLKQAEGSYFLYCDQDDVWLPDKVEKLTTKIKEIEVENPNMPALVFSDMSVINETGELIYNSYFDVANYKKIYIQNILFRGFIPGCSTIFNKHAKKLVLFYYELITSEDRKYLHDGFTFFIINIFGIITFTPEILLKYRLHQGNTVGFGKKSKKFDNVISGDRLLLALIASKGKIKYFKETLGVYRKHPGGISIYGNRIIIFKSNVQLFKQLNKFFKPKYKRVLVNQIFRWSGILTNEYYKNGKMLLFIKQLFITVLYIRSFIDFKTYIKNFLLQK